MKEKEEELRSMRRAKLDRLELDHLIYDEVRSQSAVIASTVCASRYPYPAMCR